MKQIVPGFCDVELAGVPPLKVHAYVAPLVLVLFIDIQSPSQIASLLIVKEATGVVQLITVI